jgi:hypothetical protein
MLTWSQIAELNTGGVECGASRSLASSRQQTQTRTPSAG